MKKIITLLVVLFSISELYSQTTLSFCTYVEQNGYCIFSNNKFITTPDSTTGKVFMNVKSSVALGAKLTYKIFTIAKNGEEKFTASVDQSLQRDWLMAWEPYLFLTNTKYSIKVFNDADKMICSKSFELIAGSK